MTALHGFLGRPEDWDGLVPTEADRPPWLQFFPLPPGEGLAATAGSLAWGEGSKLLSQDKGSAATKSSGTSIPTTHVLNPLPQDTCTGIDNSDVSLPPVRSSQEEGLRTFATLLNAESKGGNLVGYSMGGRIALHMILQAPALWRRAVIISASPGLSDPTERQARIENDHRWAERFRRELWDDVLAAWNAQSVFTADPPDNTPRIEADYNREALATALEQGSVGLQVDLRDDLRATETEILWLAGAKDPKYAALARECADLNPRFRARIIPNTGHRVLWGNPETLRKTLNDFLTN